MNGTIWQITDLQPRDPFTEGLWVSAGWGATTAPFPDVAESTSGPCRRCRNSHATNTSLSSSNIPFNSIPNNRRATTTPPQSEKGWSRIKSAGAISTFAAR